jgi:hypothetical protein
MPLTDGINYVKKTNQPGLVTQDTTFDLKLPTSSTIQTLSDWENEDVRLVPMLANDVVSWLNQLAVSGLSSVAEIKTSSDGHKVQIASLNTGSDGSVQVLGGTANSVNFQIKSATPMIKGFGYDTIKVSVRRGELDGVRGDNWVKIESTEPVDVTSKVFGDIESGGIYGPLDVSSDGMWNMGSTYFPYVVASQGYVLAEFQKVGGLMAISFDRRNNAIFDDFDLAVSVPEGGYLYLYDSGSTNYNNDYSSAPTSNQGVYQVLKTCTSPEGPTIWVDGPNMLEGTYNVLYRALEPGSMVPGDVLNVNTDAYGPKNRGAWKIVSVGDPYNSGEQFGPDLGAFKVETSLSSPAELAEAVYSPNISVTKVDGTTFYKKILTIVPNQSDPTYLDVQFDETAGIDYINEQNGSIAYSESKLDFDTTIHLGVDGYRYNTGLIDAVNDKLYGDGTDANAGYVSAGESVLVQGPFVRRIKVSLQIRAESGLSQPDIAAAVRSIVADVINGSPVGKALAISDIVAAANKAGGVDAVSVVAPIYSSVNDTIEIAPNEKQWCWIWTRTLLSHSWGNKPWLAHHLPSMRRIELMTTPSGSILPDHHV